MNPSAIREILKLTELPGIISLAGGLPSAATFPVEAVREATARVLRDAPREALQYAASEMIPGSSVSFRISRIAEGFIRTVRVASCQGEEVSVDAIAIPIDAGSGCVAGDPV